MVKIAKPKPGTTGLVADIYKGLKKVKKGLTSDEAKKLAALLKRNFTQTKGKTLSKPSKRMSTKGNAARFVERRKQLRGRKPKGNTAGTLTTYGVGVGVGATAGVLGTKKSQKKGKK